MSRFSIPILTCIIAFGLLLPQTHAEEFFDPSSNLNIRLDESLQLESFSKGKSDLLKSALHIQKSYILTGPVEILIASDTADKILEQLKLRLVTPEQTKNRVVMGTTALEFSGKTYDGVELRGLLFSRADSRVLILDSRKTDEAFEDLLSRFSPFNGFEDIAAHPLQADIEASIKAGIFQGYPTDKPGIRAFRPDSGINRAEFVKILLLSLPGDLNIQNWYNSWKSRGFRRTLVAFPDIDFAQWYAPFILYAQEQGFVGGYPDGKFRPGNTVNLAEAAKIILQARGVSLPADPQIWYRPFIGYFQSKGIIKPSGAGYLIGTEQKIVKPQDTVTRAELATMIMK